MIGETEVRLQRKTRRLTATHLIWMGSKVETLTKPTQPTLGTLKANDQLREANHADTEVPGRNHAEANGYPREVGKVSRIMGQTTTRQTSPKGREVILNMDDPLWTNLERP